jgi:hypothetical protein
MDLLIRLLDIPWMGEFVNDQAWVWPFCEILHFVGMVLLVGTVGLLDLRMLGMGRALPVAPLERLIPWGVFGFALNLVTGFVFVAGNPVGGPGEYLTNLAFQLKLLFILLAGINVLAFYGTSVSRTAHLSGGGDETPRAAKVVSAVSLVLWIGVIYFGRMIMYNDTLLTFQLY